jgi:hypothetical protein
MLEEMSDVLNHPHHEDKFPCPKSIQTMRRGNVFAFNHLLEFFCAIALTFIF